ncbi:hypothetical protein Godav_004336, partial [Gossypium davidsonii]|nr:hypothetical protein [Gossypium davidsonii]
MSSHITGSSCELCNGKLEEPYNRTLIRAAVYPQHIQDHNQSGYSEELLTGSSQESYNGKLEKANIGTLFRAMVCLQHIQDHNQYEKSCIHRISFI